MSNGSPSASFCSSLIQNSESILQFNLTLAEAEACGWTWTNSENHLNFESRVQILYKLRATYKKFFKIFTFTVKVII